MVMGLDMGTGTETETEMETETETETEKEWFSSVQSLWSHKVPWQYIKVENKLLIMIIPLSIQPSTYLGLRWLHTITN